jgi:hypothetical protein
VSKLLTQHLGIVTIATQTQQTRSTDKQSLDTTQRATLAHNDIVWYSLGELLRSYPIALGDHISQQKAVDSLWPVATRRGVHTLYNVALTLKALKT